MASPAFPQSNAIADLLNNTEWGFAVAECFHIVFFAVAIGTIMVVDLRLLGFAFPRTTSAKLLHDTWVYTLIGLTVTVLAGMALFLSDPRMYYLSPWFRFKAAALLLAIIYNYTIHNKVASSSSSPSPAVSVAAGAISVLLWISVVTGGLFVGLLA
jgi:hypothetical protein